MAMTFFYTIKLLFCCDSTSAKGNVVMKFLLKVFQRAAQGHRGSITQGAEAVAENARTQAFQQFYIAIAALAFFNAL